MREITIDMLSDIAHGAAVLGAGGGGDPYIGRLLAQEAIAKYGPVTLLSPDEVPDDAVVIPSAYMGAPTVMLEKLPAGGELVGAIRAVEALTGAKATHTVSAEAGGVNSMIPITAAAELGLPLIDADAMGRAFPELQMALPALAGIPATPMALADERGNALTLDTVDSHWAERLARVVVSEMGCSAAMSLYVLTGRQLKDHMVHGTITLCERVGIAIREAHAGHQDPVAAAAEALDGRVLFVGNVVDVERRTEGGFVRGLAALASTGAVNSSMQIEFQNENLVARCDGKVMASVPDLISILDTESGAAVTTEMLRYGLRVSVVASPCDVRWRSPEGLAVAGPAYFGYDHEYMPV